MFFNNVETYPIDGKTYEVGNNAKVATYNCRDAINLIYIHLTNFHDIQ